ncbi:MAG: ATP-binding protein [Rhodobacterales bacterium]|nr:ATP-binding protein [Rhodobacterales bacterium]
MTIQDELIPVLKKLRLSGLLLTLEIRGREAVDDELAHPEFLYRLLNDEVERRDSKQLTLRLKRAKFDAQKTIGDFDFRFNPSVPKALVIDLATCTFVAKREVVCLVGPSGVGKSHLAQALGHRACMAGHTVTYTSAHNMFRHLRSSRADRSFDRSMLRYTKPDLLIIDDLGLQPLKQDEPQDLYEVIRHRYERGAMVITSNRSTEEWYPLFGDPLLASAAMDRLLHHCHVVELNGDSYRNPKNKR